MTNRQSSWLTLADDICEKIRTGQLKPGDRLPSEIALQELIGKSRTTVRQAMAELRSRGQIRTLRQHGSFVLGAGGQFQLRPGESVTSSTALTVTGIDGSTRTLSAGTRIVVERTGAASDR